MRKQNGIILNFVGGRNLEREREREDLRKSEDY